MKLGLWFAMTGCALMAAPSACGSDDGSGGSGATGGSAGSGAGSGSGGQSGDAAVGGASGSDAGSDAPATDGNVPKPEPADISFQSVNAIPQGEQLLFNDWSPQPNSVSSIKPDGTGETKIFEAYRVWSMGVASDVSKIAFACGDPLQKEHYGLDIGDAIQNTWLYDVGQQSAAVLAWGNINDECHTWSPKNDSLYLCRRRDFSGTTNKTYRIGRLGLDASTTWLGLGEDSTPTTMELHPQPTADESTLYYTLIQIAGGKQSRSIMKKALPSGTPETLRTNASAGVLSPDGTRLLFADTSQKSALFSMKLDGTDLVKVASRDGTSATWSPDGKKVAYLWGETMGCAHIEVVAADGSQADTPTRIRECGSSFVTELAWVVRP